MLSDPPGPQDTDVLQTLQDAAYQRNDQEHQRWQDYLAVIDPARTLAGQIPVPPPPEPLRARFSNGNLELAWNFTDLPADEQPVHMTAAIIAGSPDGLQRLTQLDQTNPELAEGVARLLGIQKLTPAQAQAREHFIAAEELFRRKRFADAAVEYQKALDLDPDDAVALLYLGDTWFQRGAYHIAQAYFEESLAVDQSPQAFRFLGDALLHSDGSRDRARACYLEALRLDPSYGGAKTALAHPA
jgi:tetratricopeptide (TPR) repeat protein